MSTTSTLKSTAAHAHHPTAAPDSPYAFGGGASRGPRPPHLSEEERKAAVARRLRQMRGSTASLIDAKIELAWNYVVKGWLLRKETSIVFGASNVGKTTFVVDLVRAVATDQEWHGCRTRRGGVLYIAAESSVSVVERAKDLLDDDGSRVFIADFRPNLLNVLDVDAVIALARTVGEEIGEPIAMIVFDTLTLCIGAGDENSNADAVAVSAAAQRIAKEADAHVLLVHHSGKDRSAGPRGASGLVGNADTVIELARHATDTDSYVLAKVTKQRRMGKPTAFAFDLVEWQLGLDEDDEPRTTARLEAREDLRQAAPPQKAAGAEGAARERAVAEALRTLSAHDPAAPGFLRSVIADACADGAAFKGLSRESLMRAVRRAVDGAYSGPNPSVIAVSKDLYRVGDG